MSRRVTGADTIWPAMSRRRVRGQETVGGGARVVAAAPRRFTGNGGRLYRGSAERHGKHKNQEGLLSFVYTTGDTNKSSTAPTRPKFRTAVPRRNSIDFRTIGAFHCHVMAAALPVSVNHHSSESMSFVIQHLLTSIKHLNISKLWRILNKNIDALFEYSL